MAAGRITAAVALLSLSTLGVASPTPAFRSLELFERDDNPCDYQLNDDEESRRAIWDTDGVGAGKFLEDWIKEHGEEDWINKMDEDLYTVGESSFWCNSLGGANCPDPDTCSKYKDANVPQLYWILKAAKTHYELMNHVNDYLQSETIKNTLAIPDIEDNFNHEGEGDSKIFSIIGSSLVTASAGAGPIGPEISAALTVAIGAVGLGGAFAGEAVDYTKDIATQMQQAFSAAVDGLAVTLNLAMTARNDKSDKTTADLPNMSGPWSTNIAKYFDGGKFLVSNIEAVTSPLLDNLGKLLKQGAVNAILKPQEYFVFINTDISEEDCGGSGDKSPQFWVDNSCADFWKLDGDEPNVMGKGGKNEEVSDMMDLKYGGFDIAKMYENAIQCARDHPDGDGEVDTNDLPTDGSIAPCFFNYPVFKGVKNHHYGTYYLCHGGDDEINTTGRRASDICD